MRRTHLILLIAALTVPIVLVLLVALGRLLAALGDAAAAGVLDRIALAGGLVWAADLIGLVIVQGIMTAEHEAHDTVIEHDSPSAGFESDEP